MILDLNKKLTIFLMLFFVSCSKNEVINNVEKDVHDQLSTNVEITLTKKGNITAKIKSEIMVVSRLYRDCIMMRSRCSVHSARCIPPREEC